MAAGSSMMARLLYLLHPATADLRLFLPRRPPLPIRLRKKLRRLARREEKAKKKIYNVFYKEMDEGTSNRCHFTFFGFGCEIDEETSNKLEGL
ncbi:hypothetical protein RJT34_32263 [Clitoria ternatea]|uniref:Uncharacterized protein n=1 Tax=Clitoria ternatea TaxID=43366 RepID=A0AAN9I4D7_CLITE